MRQAKQITVRSWIVFSIALLGFNPAYANPFSARFFQAVYEFTGYYGNGADGALSVSGVPNGPSNPYLINTTATKLTANALAATTTLTVSSIAGFAAGQEILVIQMLGTDAGKYEFATVSATGGSNITISSGLTQSYYSADTIQVIKVMRYSSVTINSGGFITVPAFNSGTGVGGVLVMKVSGILDIKNGGGGLAGHISTGGGYASLTPRGYAGGVSAAGQGPGGGAAASNVGGTNTSPGESTRLIMGSGGGSAANTGGIGGGLVLIKANTLNIDGGIRANGQTPGAGNAGGGAGGTVFVAADSITTSGTCGNFSADGGSQAGTGTAGSGGRLFIHYRTTLNCKASSPAATTTIRKFNVK